MRILPCFMLLAALTGCVSTDDGGFSTGGHGHGSTLSEGMKSSAQGDSRPLSSSHSSGSSDTVTLAGAVAAGFLSGMAEGAMEATEGGGMVTYADRQFNVQLLADAAYQLAYKGDIEAIARFTAPLAFETERHFMAVYLGGGIVDLVPGSLPDRATKDPWMFEVGFAYRFYLTPPRYFFSPYLTADISARSVTWVYRNPIVVDGHQIDSDSLGAVNGYVGFGLAVHRDWPWTCFAEVGTGGMGFVGETWQGFDNDVFDSFGYFSVKVGICVKF